eukprot:9434886-Pyramimonas_sp.AAC.1
MSTAKFRIRPVSAALRLIGPPGCVVFWGGGMFITVIAVKPWCVLSLNIKASPSRCDEAVAHANSPEARNHKHEKCVLQITPALLAHHLGRKVVHALRSVNVLRLLPPK